MKFHFLRALVVKAREISRCLETSKSRQLTWEREDTQLFMGKANRLIINRPDQDSLLWFLVFPNNLKRWALNNNRINHSTMQWCKCKPCNRTEQILPKCFINAMIGTLISSDLSNKHQIKGSHSRRFNVSTKMLNQMLRQHSKCQ
jgi:hypothetical protein